MSRRSGALVGGVALCLLGAVGCYAETEPPGATPSAVPGAETDSDQDGWSIEEGDCDDHDAAINPAMLEICDADNRDENCNNLADNADPNADTDTRTLFYHDVDHDGFGDPQSPQSACDDPSSGENWWTTDASDCNDRDPDTHPDAPEICGDGDDNNCDGAIDEASCGTPAPTPTAPQSTDAPGTPPLITASPTAVPIPTSTPTERPPIEPRTPRPTPTVAPTPTQIPPPAEVWQGFTAFSVAPEGQGLDYNGDGTIDNAIYAALAVVQSELTTIAYAAIDSMTDFDDQVDECESGPEGCSLNQAQNQVAKVAVRELIADFASVDTINEALASTFELATTPWAIHLVSQGPDTTLNYYAGSVQQVEGSYGFKAERHIGAQGGSLRTGGGISFFGPGIFTITVVIEDEDGIEEPTVIGFNVEDARTELPYGETRSAGAITGGAVEISAFVALIENMLTSFAESGFLPDDYDVEAAIADATAVLVEACDLTCSSTGEPCFSISLSYDAERLNQVFPLD